MENASDSSIERLGSSVCHVCRGLGDLKNPRGALVEIPEEQQAYGHYLYIYMHHSSLAALARSAEAGCSICKMLRWHLRLSEGDNGAKFDKAATAVSPALITASTHAESKMNVGQSDDDFSVATRVAEHVKSNIRGAKFYLRDIDKGRIIIQHSSRDKLGLRGTTDKFRFEAYVLDTDIFSKSLHGFRTSYDQFDPDLKHRPSPHLLSDPHISLIQHWRDTCKDNHASCRTTACDPQLPSRVLKLDLNKQDGVHLIETHGKKKGTYACLSYCWGGSKIQTGQTNRSNLSKHLQGIPLNDLPGTVVDTICLCRKLGFQYLWVDRLCIIQDDKEDWARESSKMCDIYSGSELTISAPICRKSSQSLQHERDKWWFERRRHFGAMELTDEKPNSKSSLWLYYNSYQRDPWNFEKDWLHFCKVSKYKWEYLGRGWTFQEWMLSPRVLHIDSVGRCN